MNWIPAGIVDAIAPTTGFVGSTADLIDLLRRLEDVGADEVQLIPTSKDIGQLSRIADVLA
jgi:hypothetical protein